MFFAGLVGLANLSGQNGSAVASLWHLGESMLFICCLPFVGTMLIPLLGEYDFEASWSIGKAGLAFNMFEYFLGTLQQSYYNFATMLFPLTFASLPPKSSLNSFRIAHAQDYQSMLLNVFRGISMRFGVCTWLYSSSTFRTAPTKRTDAEV